MNIKKKLLVLLLIITFTTFLYSLGSKETTAATESSNNLTISGTRYWEVTSKEGADLIKNIKPFILDVRTDGEYAEGHLQDSYLLPVQVLSEQISLIEKYKDQDILIYCRSGNRSTVASKILLDAGFTNVYNLCYGIKGWLSDGYPIVLE